MSLRDNDFDPTSEDKEDQSPPELKRKQESDSIVMDLNKSHIQFIKINL